MTKKAIIKELEESGILVGYRKTLKMYVLYTPEESYFYIYANRIEFLNSNKSVDILTPGQWTLIGELQKTMKESEV